MSSLTEVQLATVGLMQAGSVALTFRCNLSFEDNVTSGRMVRRGGEALVKKGRKKKKRGEKYGREGGKKERGGRKFPFFPIPPQI